MSEPRNVLKILLIFCLLPIAGCNQAPEKVEEALRPVRFLTMSTPESGLTKTLPGVVEAEKKASLSFRVSGKLNELLVHEGSRVEAGQKLAQLDQTDFIIQLNDRKASYEVAKADYDRAAKLMETGAIARADVDALKAKASTALAQLESARKELEYTALKAPFAGRIAKRFVDNFEEISAKQEVVSLQDISSLLIKVEMPASVIAQSKGQLERQPLSYSASFTSIPGQTFPLTVDAFSSQASDNSQTYTITFIMDMPDQRLIWPGMSAQVTIRQMASENSPLRVPSNTVMEDNRGRYVYLVEELSDDTGLIKRRTVTTGELTGEGIEVHSGLAVGERLVTAGMNQLTEGMTVLLQQESAE